MPVWASAWACLSRRALSLRERRACGLLTRGRFVASGCLRSSPPTTLQIVALWQWRRGTGCRQAALRANQCERCGACTQRPAAPAGSAAQRAVALDRPRSRVGSKRTLQPKPRLRRLGPCMWVVLPHHPGVASARAPARGARQAGSTEASVIHARAQATRPAERSASTLPELSRCDAPLLRGSRPSHDGRGGELARRICGASPSAHAAGRRLSRGRGRGTPRRGKTRSAARCGQVELAARVLRGWRRPSVASGCPRSR